MKLINLACVLMVSLMVLSTTTGLAQEEGGEVQVFEELGPIPDADPETRHEEILQIPERLIVEPGDYRAYVSFDSTSVRTVKLSVGHKMVVGCEWTLYYFDGLEKIEIRRNLGGSPQTLLNPGHMVFKGLAEAAAPQGSLQLIAELTIFETDIPMQHMWNPKLGRYRPLWKGLATGVLRSTR
jgi:hypothetical protein